MCLILFAYHIHPDYPLIVAANRDEFYDRPSASAHRWSDAPHVIAGRDLLKRGTWLGIADNGRFAGLTNYRDPLEQTQGKRSRGELVANFLTEEIALGTYMEQIHAHAYHYPGYNLLAGDRNELYYYSNISRQRQRLEQGIYGISNHLLDTGWPKVERGKDGLRQLLQLPLAANSEQLGNALFTLLQLADRPADELLPNTGVPLEWERVLSSIFIHSEASRYGTRCSTIVMMNEQHIHLRERTYAPELADEQRFTIALQSQNEV
ncbi:NRDE family protein [Paenibacillus campi]|uniref:NRDE family protein n=1 Tax=Paenibacillus campi TaxID=3106031 RepID=UPI002AFE238B|nr:NRDE family protein [Paenibacillus sp. SGZ-1014]